MQVCTMILYAVMLILILILARALLNAPFISISPVIAFHTHTDVLLVLPVSVGENTVVSYMGTGAYQGLNPPFP